MQELRKKLKVLDATYGIGTGISLPHAITEWCLSTYVYTHFYFGRNYWSVSLFSSQYCTYISSWQTHGPVRSR
jgi:hypothetical protein